MDTPLKLPTVLVCMLVVLTVLAPMETTEAAASLQKLKDFMNSVMELATAQAHHSHRQGHHRNRHHRVATTTAAPPVEQLLRNELEELLEAQLQEINSSNETNKTFEYDPTNSSTDYYDIENATVGYNASRGTEGYDARESYNTTTEAQDDTGTTETEGYPTEEGTKWKEKGRKSGDKGSKSNSKTKEEGSRSRTCNHKDGEGFSDIPTKWREYFEYVLREHPTKETAEEPATEPALEPATEPVSEPATGPVSEPATEPVSEPATEPVSEPATEPVSEPTVEPVSEPTTESVSELVSEPATEPVLEPATEPVSQSATEGPTIVPPQSRVTASLATGSSSVPTATSEPLKRKSYMYMYAQEYGPPESHLVTLQTPRNRHVVYYVPLNLKEVCIIAEDHQVDVERCRRKTRCNDDTDCEEDRDHQITICDTINTNKVCYCTEKTNIC